MNEARECLFCGTEEDVWERAGGKAICERCFPLVKQYMSDLIRQTGHAYPSYGNDVFVMEDRGQKGN